MIGSVIPVPDETTTHLMAAFHRHLRAGGSPAAALARAQLEAADDEYSSIATAAGFVAMGAG